MESGLLVMGVGDGLEDLGHGQRLQDHRRPGAPRRRDLGFHRRHVARQDWTAELFNTSTAPKGHGFHLVDPVGPAATEKGFSCYSFVPNPAVPLKIIVLDDTQRKDDGSHDIHGHGYLDAVRWAWLKNELAEGQADGQLMIISAHVPIGVSAIGSEMEWWSETAGIAPGLSNAVSLADLVATLNAAPNLLMWISGHRHFNTVKAFVSPDPAHPEMDFWQFETSSLRDFPQQFRTFEIRLNENGTVSVITLNVDPAVAEGTPAATSRRCAVAVQQIGRNDLRLNVPNDATLGGKDTIPLPSMDPSRPQDGLPAPSIRFTDLAAADPPVPYHASCNAELVVPLSPDMAAKLKALF